MAFDIYLNKAGFEANEGIKFLTGIAQNPPRSSAEVTALQKQAEAAFGTAKKPPEEPPGTGGGGAPPPISPNQPAAPGSTPAAQPGIGEKIKGAVKKFWEEEEGSLTLPNLRKADRAAA